MRSSLLGIDWRMLSAGTACRRFFRADELTSAIPACMARCGRATASKTARRLGDLGFLPASTSAFASYAAGKRLQENSWRLLLPIYVALIHCCHPSLHMPRGIRLRSFSRLSFAYKLSYISFSTGMTGYYLFGVSLCSLPTTLPARWNLITNAALRCWYPLSHSHPAPASLCCLLYGRQAHIFSYETTCGMPYAGTFACIAGGWFIRAFLPATFWRTTGAYFLPPSLCYHLHCLSC